ncbi:hypothetical protein BOX15_Mlig031143g1 [Macrostomum lignano]|uniref:Uncharacterized protein n=2 Tax=Macrostomum lignano TaxID=282301 RepID=A0A267EPA4_9PLAT|nr:hypothetical protein BOX15_Mlig031143g2 [Macrostomum lignano]PAA69240.1 hypothetical protein BOX15_Mlig031143g1 [Macrostomum lignano]
MSTEWYKNLIRCEKSYLVQNGRVTVRYTLKGVGEMIEEYDVKSYCLLGRKWKRESLVGKEGSWEFELGDPPPSAAPSAIAASISNPIFRRSDTAKEFQWRIRNLPYPIETYSLDVDASNENVILRTSNKKYYKKFDVPDMRRCGIPIDKTKLSMSHANNTLLIVYPKPKAITDFESMVAAELRKRCNKDGDVGMVPENGCAVQ